MTNLTSILQLDYVEFATRDIAAARTFFSAAFGWKYTDYGPEYTSFSDGRLSGGFFAAPEPPAKTNPMVVLYAANLEEAASRVTRAGGRITKPAFEFPGGRRFHFADPTGL